MRIWAWVTAAAGLAIVVLTFIDGAELGVWADDHMTVSESLPSSLGQFAVAGIGVVLFVGGLIVGLSRSSGRPRGSSAERTDDEVG